MAGNYTWTGNTSSAWSVSSNWSPSGVPGTNDTVTIGSGSDTILLASNTTINRLVINGRTLNLGDYELEVSQKATLSGGKIYNGTLKLRGALATFSGTHTDCQIDCIAGQLEFNGGVFDGEGSFEQNGSAGGNGSGGCVFNAPITIKKSTNALLRLGTAIPDTFNSRVEFICVDKMPLEISYGSASVFNDIVSVSCYGANSEITIGNDTDTVQFNGDAALATGEEGLTDGVVILKRISQSGIGDNELSGDEGFVIHIESCTFNGGMFLSAPSILLKNSMFWGDVTLTKIRASSNNYSYGGNSFYGRATLENQDGTYAFRLANNAGDHFYNDVVFASSSNRIQMAYSGTSYFEGNLSINSSDIKFNTSSGKVVLTGDKNQTLEGTDPYLLCKLEINKTAGTVQLDQQMTIDSAITFVNGIINTDSVITLKAATTCTGASNLSFADGPVKKIGNTAFVFPVGDEGRIGSIEISAPAVNTESFTARYFERPAREVSDSIDTSLSIVSQCNYWSLNRNTGSTNVKVRLYWDTIGCALFDTTSIRIAEFTGSAWKGLGKTSLTGNSDIGNCQNFDNVTGYNYFTIGVVVTTQNVDMQFNSIDRPIQEDFFGFNGANTIERNISGAANQTWADIYSDNFTGTPHLRTLAYSPVNTIRYPAGTLSNYFDWRAGWYIREKHLPNNWLYDKPKYRIEPDYGGNELADFVQNLNLMAARPILVWNILTSKLTYEIASTYRLGEVNLPLKYIELGNEFYLNDDQYKEVFPSVMDYLNKSRDWIQDYRSIQIPQSTNVKFAVVGSDYGAEVPGRRKLWLKTLLDNISPSDEIDAVTVHDYIGTGLSDLTGNCLTVGPNQLKTYLNKAFKDGQTLRANTFADIQAANQGHLSGNPLEMWLTEFNNLDDENSYIGTWPHGLFNAAMALQYLETPEVSKVITHTMISDGVFGNIFESTAGFDNITCHGETNGNATRMGEFTALGNALNQIALALHNATNAKVIEFTPQAGSNIPPITTSSSYPVLYGWYFENTPGEIQIIILNLDFNTSHEYELTLPSGIYTGTVQYDQLTSSNFQNAIMGNANLSGGANEIKLETNTLSGLTLTLTAGSITRIYPQQAPLQLKLTDNEICVGSTTSLVVSGGTGTINIPSVTGLSISQLDLGNSATSDHYWEITANNPGTYTITVTDGSNSEFIVLTVHDDLIDLEIEADGNPVTGPILFCQGSPLTLSASFTPGSTGTNSNSNLNDYHFIWAPDTGIISNACSTSTFLPYCDEVEVAPERTTNYTVYITDDHCWQSASVLIKVPVSSVDLGPDFNACAGTNNPIDLEPIVEAESGSTLSYYWSNSQTTSGITLTSLAAGANVYTVTVTATLSGFSCSVQESIQINGESCCTGIANSVTALPVNFNNPETGLNEYYIFGDQLYDAVNNACPTCVDWIPPNSGLNDNNTRLDIDLSSSSPTLSIIVNQTLVLRNDIKDAGGAVLLDGYNLTIRNANIFFGPEAKIILRQGRKLTLENCTLDVCGNEMWKGIEVEPIADDGEPHIILKNCVIMNAEQSILLCKNAQFEIENCTFTDNYIDIYIEKYSKKNLDLKFDPSGDPNGVATQNFIRSNTFTSSGGYLLPPYNTVHKFAAIVLDNVERVVIGDSSEDAGVDYNYFSHSNFGINAFNSSVEVYHSNFENITALDPQLSKVLGAGIFVQSASDYNDRMLIVGNKNYSVGANTSPNHFISMNYGIVANGELNCKLFNNVFGNGNPDARITKYGIWTNGTMKKEVYITRGNEFNDYYVGINSFGIHPDGIYHIGYNNFNKSYIPNWSVVNSFQGTAIYMANSYLSPTVSSKLETPQINIYNNEIGQINQEIEPRIGIFISQIYQPVIQNNNIYYYRNSPVSKPHSIGIWVQACVRPKVAGNLMLEPINTYPGYGANLIGMQLDRNINPCIGSQNIMENLGFGINFKDNNGQVGLSTNQFTNCDNGISLDYAEIGVQGDPDRTDDNEWTDRNLTPILNRVNGSTQNSQLIQWYYKPTPAEFSPLPSGSVIPFQIASPGTPLLDCPIIQSIASRNLTYGSVVADTARYEENYQQAFRYSGKVITYKALKSDTSLIDMDDESDASFIDFYYSMNQSNIEKYDSVSLLISQREFAMAATILTGINDTNEQEEYLSAFYNLYLSKIVFDSTLSAQDSSFLLDMAYSHSLLYGDAVFMARNALFLEVHDAALESNLRRAVTGDIIRANEISIRPNPAKENIRLYFNEKLFNGKVQVLDGQGQLLRDQTIENGFLDIKNMNAGIYLIKAINSDNSLVVGKLVLIR